MSKKMICATYQPGYDGFYICELIENVWKAVWNWIGDKEPLLKKYDDYDEANKAAEQYAKEIGAQFINMR